MCTSAAAIRPPLYRGSRGVNARHYGPTRSSAASNHVGGTRSDRSRRRVVIASRVLGVVYHRRSHSFRRPVTFGSTINGTCRWVGTVMRGLTTRGRPGVASVGSSSVSRSSRE